MFDHKVILNELDIIEVTLRNAIEDEHHGRINDPDIRHDNPVGSKYHRALAAIAIIKRQVEEDAKV